eukprot:763025-Hanusia_phi.AAC.2
MPHVKSSWGRAGADSVVKPVLPRHPSWLAVLVAPHDHLQSQQLVDCMQTRRVQRPASAVSPQLPFS